MLVHESLHLVEVSALQVLHSTRRDALRGHLQLMAYNIPALCELVLVGRAAVGAQRRDLLHQLQAHGLAHQRLDDARVLQGRQRHLRLAVGAEGQHC